MMECTPGVNELVEKAACPVPSSVTFPRNVLPSKKDVVPVGVPFVELNTAAVKMT